MSRVINVGNVVYSIVRLSSVLRTRVINRIFVSDYCINALREPGNRRKFRSNGTSMS